MGPKTSETSPQPSRISVLTEKNQPIGSFDVPFFYQISEAGNPNTDPCCHQIRIPDIINDGTDISMIRVGDLIFITNTGSTVVETTSFKFAKISDPDDSPNETTLTPGKNIQLKPDETALVEISWDSQSENEEQRHIVARFIFNQNNQQIYASCKVQPIPVTPLHKI